MNFYEYCNCKYNNIINKNINFNKIKINNIKEVKIDKEILDIIVFL